MAKKEVKSRFPTWYVPPSLMHSNRPDHCSQQHCLVGWQSRYRRNLPCQEVPSSQKTYSSSCIHNCSIVGLKQWKLNTKLKLLKQCPDLLCRHKPKRGQPSTGAFLFWFDVSLKQVGSWVTTWDKLEKLSIYCGNIYTQATPVKITTTASSWQKYTSCGFLFKYDYFYNKHITRQHLMVKLLNKIMVSAFHSTFVLLSIQHSINEMRLEEEV